MAMFGDISIRGLQVIKVTIADKKCSLRLVSSYTHPETGKYEDQTFLLTVFPDRGKSVINRFTLANLERIRGNMEKGRQVLVDFMGSFCGVISSFTNSDGELVTLKKPMVKLIGSSIMMMDKAGYEINKQCYRKLKSTELDYDNYEKAVVQSDKEEI